MFLFHVVFLASLVALGYGDSVPCDDCWPIHPYPYVVSLMKWQDKTINKYCAGIILSESWILTTAHCVDDPKYKNDIVAVAGILEASNFKSSDAQVRKVVRVVKHEKYRGSKYEEIPSNDIALLKVERPFVKNSYVRFAKLMKAGESVTGFGEAVGWGASNLPVSETQSETLLFVSLDISDQKKCLQSYNYPQLDKFCAGNHKQGACSGDGGGPFVQYNQTTGQAYVSGLASVAAVPCNSKPAMYTQINLYLDFISEVTHSK